MAETTEAPARKRRRVAAEDEKGETQADDQAQDQAADQDEQEPEAPPTKDELYLLECGWERSESGRRWKDGLKGTKPHRNDLGQYEYPNEHRAYTTDEALRIQKLREETEVYHKRVAQEREKLRVRPPLPV